MNKLIVKKAAVLGAGVMGAQIAAHLANANVPVVLFDLPAKDGDKNGVVKKALDGLKKLDPAPLANKGKLKVIDAANYDEHLPRLQEFILPAGTRAASQAHVCRTVARRAERAVVALQESENMRSAPRQYLNRLSDLLFVLARVLNRVDGGDDVYWKSERLARAAAEE